MPKNTSKDKDNKCSENSDSDSEWLPGTEDDEKMNTFEMQKFMQKLFPSKGGKERLKKLEKLNNAKNKNKKHQAIQKLKKNVKLNSRNMKVEENDTDVNVESKFNDDKKQTKEIIKSSDEDKSLDEREVSSEAHNTEESEVDNSSECCSDNDDGNVNSESDITSDDDEDDYYDDDEDFENMLGQNMKFNIVFTVDEGGEVKYSNDGEFEEYDSEGEYTEEDDEDNTEVDTTDDNDDEEKVSEVNKKTNKSGKKGGENTTDENESKGAKSKGANSKGANSKGANSKGAKSKGSKSKDTKENEHKVKRGELENDNVSSNTSQRKFNRKDKVLVKGRDWDEEYSGIITKVCTRNRYDVRLDDRELDERNWKMINGKYIKPLVDELEEQDKVLKEIKELVELRNTKGKEAMIKKFDQLSKITEKKQKKKEAAEKKKLIEKNAGQFKKLINNRTKTNDIKYFKDMSLDAQKNIIKQLKEVNKHTYIQKPYRMALLELGIPSNIKAVAMKKINILNHMDPGSSEYYKVKQWVDSFMEIPFGKNINLPVEIGDGHDKCAKFMEEAKQILDESIYGLEDAKMQMMQYLGQLIVNPNSVGCSLALVGPPGTGKTTLIKEAFSKIMKRPFAMCALGGAEDGAHWKGHDYTYMESKFGRIVEILIQSKCMNPMFYFDELCKLSAGPKGDEVTGVLTHLTDTTQNDKFQDKFFSEIEFDLSKALFIFSYNDEDKVNPILKDRMYRIHTKGYDSKDKVVIAKKHLVPKIEKNIKFEPGEIVIPDKIIEFIVKEYTEGEKGVRNLKRCLEIIYTKINLYKLMPPNSKLFDGNEVIKITNPFEVTEEVVKKLIKMDDSWKPPAGLFI